MTKPKAKPDPKQGQYQVVVSFRMPPAASLAAIRSEVGKALQLWAHPNPLVALYVTAYEIGAGGETSEHEGTVGL